MCYLPESSNHLPLHIGRLILDSPIGMTSLDLDESPGQSVQGIIIVECSTNLTTTAWRFAMLDKCRVRLEVLQAAWTTVPRQFMITLVLLTHNTSLYVHDTIG